MFSAHRKVSVYDLKGNAIDQLALPSVFTGPIWTDIVQFFHASQLLNARQAHVVNPKAGHRTSAESWGTGRAVSRILRVPRGGTHRAGQGVFGNMCRGGRIFAPIYVWRKWHRKSIKKLRHFAIALAIAASVRPSLIMAKGHLMSGKKWHRKSNKKTQTFCNCISSSNICPSLLLMAKDHLIPEAIEIPLVVDDSSEGVSKTKLSAGQGPRV